MGYEFDANKSHPGRKPRWCIRFTGPDGEEVHEPGAGTQDASKRLRLLRERQVQEGTFRARRKGGRLTFATYEVKHSARRLKQGKKLAHDEHKRMERYVVPLIGDRPIDGIERDDIVAVIGALMEAGTLAPKTIINLYGELRMLFNWALKDKVIATNPCTLSFAMDELPKKRDKNPNWRAQAKYSKPEAFLLITSELVPPDRQVLYALEYLGGMRSGEAAGRRWRDWDVYAEPLSRMVIATQYDDQPLKTERPRELPVHPWLAHLLQRWRMHGWPVLYGKPPRDDNFIVPKRLEYGGGCRDKHTMWNQLQDDLRHLGLRPRRVHDLRRSLITHARGDGANKDALKACTHGGKGDIVDDYTSWDWTALCQAIGSLRMPPRPSPAAAFQPATDAFDGGVSGEFGSRRNDYRIFATPTGIEQDSDLHNQGSFRMVSPGGAHADAGKNHRDSGLADKQLTPDVSRAEATTIELTEALSRLAELVRSGRLTALGPAERAELAAAATEAAERLQARAIAARTDSAAG